MRLLYIQRGMGHGNDDEGAIAYAFRSLGYTVTTVHERKASYYVKGNGRDVATHDVCLFHKWDDFDTMARVEIPKVFWNFDWVNGGTRLDWMHKVVPLCLTGFCTDGDYVQAWNGDNPPTDFLKLHWLTQGMDERQCKPVHGSTGKAPGQFRRELECDILFTGACGNIHGDRRRTFVEELQTRYGDRFRWVGKRQQDCVHGRRLADLFASAKVVIAPDWPVTDRYWSNRLYLTVGMGGFLLHPWSQGVCDQYSTDEVVLYRDRDSLFDLIDHYTQDGMRISDERERVSLNAREQTLHHHLYRHRCAEMVKVLEGLLG